MKERLVKILAFWLGAELILRIAGVYAPAVIGAMDGLTASLNNWFAGLAPWCADAVHFCERIGAYVGTVAPFLGHAALVAVLATGVMSLFKKKGH